MNTDMCYSFKITTFSKRGNGCKHLNCNKSLFARLISAIFLKYSTISYCYQSNNPQTVVRTLEHWCEYY